MTSTETRELQRGIGTRQLSMIAIGRRAIEHWLVLRERWSDSPSRPRRRVAGVRDHGSGGLLHDAVAGRDGHAVADSRLCSKRTRSALSTRRWVLRLAGYYWFSWAITLAAELVAGALIVKFWFRIRTLRSGP